MFQNNPERAQDAFVLQGVCDDVLVTNGQVFHDIPPPFHYGGGSMLRLPQRDRVSRARCSLNTWVWNTRSMIFWVVTITSPLATAPDTAAACRVGTSRPPTWWPRGPSRRGPPWRRTGGAHIFSGPAWYVRWRARAAAAGRQAGGEDAHRIALPVMATPALPLLLGRAPLLEPGREIKRPPPSRFLPGRSPG